MGVGVSQAENRRKVTNIRKIPPLVTKTTPGPGTAHEPTRGGQTKKLNLLNKRYILSKIPHIFLRPIWPKVQNRQNDVYAPTIAILTYFFLQNLYFDPYFHEIVIFF